MPLSMELSRWAGTTLTPRQPTAAMMATRSTVFHGGNVCQLASGTERLQCAKRVSTISYNNSYVDNFNLNAINVLSQKLSVPVLWRLTTAVSRCQGTALHQLPPTAATTATNSTACSTESVWVMEVGTAPTQLATQSRSTNLPIRTKLNSNSLNIMLAWQYYSNILYFRDLTMSIIMLLYH